MATVIGKVQLGVCPCPASSTCLRTSEVLRILTLHATNCSFLVRFVSRNFLTLHKDSVSNTRLAQLGFQVTAGWSHAKPHLDDTAL